MATPRGFNSRAPRGARHVAGHLPRPPESFNSRAPRGARRYHRFMTGTFLLVSIHVPLAEHDYLAGALNT